MIYFTYMKLNSPHNSAAELLSNAVIISVLFLSKLMKKNF